MIPATMINPKIFSVVFIVIRLFSISTVVYRSVKMADNSSINETNLSKLSLIQRTGGGLTKLGVTLIQILNFIIK